MSQLDEENRGARIKPNRNIYQNFIAVAFGVKQTSAQLQATK